MKSTRTRSRKFFRVTWSGSFALLALAVLSPAVIAVGSGSFTPHPVTPFFGGGYSNSIVLGDLDGDDDLDVVVVNGAGQGSTVWINDGSGSLMPHPSIATFAQFKSTVDAALGDLDSDGDLDAVIANAGGGQAETVWLNDGSGGFTAHPTTPEFGAGNSFGLALGDLDGDGDLDAIIANFSGGPETVWVNDGAGNFTPHPITPAFGAGSSRGVELGDLDGDGDLDAVVANSDQGESVWVNDGAGSLAPHPITATFGAGSNSTDVALGDLDGDGDLDAAVATSDQGQTVWINDGLGGFTAHPILAAFGGTSSGLALGDLDSDGDLDAVIASASLVDTTEKVWFNDGTGGFTPHVNTPTFGGGNSSAVALGDMDGDGDLDVLVANLDDEAETIWINLDANTPPTAEANSYSVNEDQSLTVAAPGVLGNDSDPDGTTLTAVLVSGPGHGASFTMNADGSFSYSPAANFAGTDSFSYRARDQQGADSAAVTVSIMVNPIDDAPTVAVGPGGQALSERSGRINLVVADGDTPAGNLTLSATSSNPQLVSVGNVVFGGTGANRTVAITAAAGRTGSATITLTVSDGSSSTSTIVTVLVGGNGRDTLNGTEGADILFGQNGDDILRGNGGRDLLCGGNGNDTMTGGADADSFSGGPGANTLTDFNAAAGDTTDGA